MSKFFQISGFFKDDKVKFSGYVVKETDEVNDDEDDFVFYYGLREDQIKEAIELGWNTDLEFVIQDYSELILDDSI